MNLLTMIKSIFRKPVPAEESVTCSGTVPAPVPTCRASEAYLRDQHENVICMPFFPFIIGRNPVQNGNGLSLSGTPEISGVNAAIIFENGKYYLEDMNSTNGTFITDGDKEKRITREELYDGCMFSLYRSRFTFHMDSRAGQTCIIGTGEDYQNSSTVPLTCTDEQITSETDYDSYITDKSGKTIFFIENYPFRSDTEPPFVIDKINIQSGTLYCISSEETVYAEDECVTPGEKAELFSGCCFRAGKHEYRFHIKK